MCQRHALHNYIRASGWLAFLLRRVFFIVVVAFAIVYLCILGLRLSTNSIPSGGRSRSVWDQAGPALSETVSFFDNLLHGDLGYAIQGILQRTRAPVTKLLVDACLQSAHLLLMAVGLATVAGIAAGGVAAAHRHSALALPTLTLTVIGVSIPSFFLALLLRVADIAFYRHTGVGLVPVFGSSLDRTQSLLPHVTFPALVLAARPLAHITRVTFVTISGVLDQDFIRTARSKGLGPIAVFWRHALRNAGVAILTAVVVSLRFALGSLPVVEVFFDWPGVGSTMLNAIYDRETNVVAALALAMGMSFLVVNLLVDLIYRLIDPRLRVQPNGGNGA